MSGRRPVEALAQLRGEAADGRLAVWCATRGIRLLVAFGSAVEPERSALARDLDLAILADAGTDILTAIDRLVAHVGLDEVDVLDLRRAGPVAREEALVRGELLVEDEPALRGRLAAAATLERADTQWLRDLSLAAITR